MCQLVVIAVCCLKSMRTKNSPCPAKSCCGGRKSVPLSRKFYRLKFRLYNLNFRLYILKAKMYNLRFRR